MPRFVFKLLVCLFTTLGNLAIGQDFFDQIDRPCALNFSVQAGVAYDQIQEDPFFALKAGVLIAPSKNSSDREQWFMPCALRKAENGLLPGLVDRYEFLSDIYASYEILLNGTESFKRVEAGFGRFNLNAPRLSGLIFPHASLDILQVNAFIDEENYLATIGPKLTGNLSLVKKAQDATDRSLVVNAAASIGGVYALAHKAEGAMLPTVGIALNIQFESGETGILVLELGRQHLVGVQSSSISGQQDYAHFKWGMEEAKVTLGVENLTYGETSKATNRLLGTLGFEFSF